MSTLSSPIAAFFAGLVSFISPGGAKKPTLRLVAILGPSIAAAAIYYSTRGNVPTASPPSTPIATRDGWSGKTAPEFVLQSRDNKTVKLSNFRGRVTLVNFWATWCAPCRLEMPALVALRTAYRTRGFEIVGVAMDDGDRAKVEAFVHDMNVGYPIVLKDASVGDAYGGVRFLPQSFLLDRDGKVLAHIVGMRDKDAFEAEIRRVLSASAHV